MRMLLLAALALLAAAAPATAGPRLHGIPAHVWAGHELRITWTGLGPEAQEAELELSLAGGRWVRISPELEAREGGFTWHVPAGLAGAARLRLRFGGEGFEAEGQALSPFVFESASATGPCVAEPAVDDWAGLGRRGGALPFPHVSGAASLHRASLVCALAREPESPLRFAAMAAAANPARKIDRTQRHALAGNRIPPRGYPLRI